MASGTIEKTLPPKVNIYETTVNFEFSNNSGFLVDDVKTLLNSFATEDASTAILHVTDSVSKGYTFLISYRNKNYFKARLLTYYLDDAVIYEIEKVNTIWKKTEYTGTQSTW